LDSEEQAGGIAESIALSACIDVAKERKRLDIAALVHPIACYLHVALTNCLALDIIKVNSLVLGVVLDDFENEEAVDDIWASISGIEPQGSCRRTLYPYRALKIPDQ
jgi:hypothetical protein